MGNEKDIIINIDVRYEDALNQIGKLKTENDELKDSEKRLKDELKNGKITREEYNRSLAATQAQYKNNASGIKILEKEIQNNLKYEQAQLGSREKLRAELALNVAAYDKLSEAERNSAKGNELNKQIAETNAKLKEIEQSYGDHRRSVGDYEKATVNLTGQLKGLIAQLTEMRMEGKEDTAEFKSMQAEAAKLKDAIGDTKEGIANLAKDTSSLTALNQGIQTLVGSFGMYASAMGIADEDNEKLAETMKSLQIVMASLASATAIQNALQKQSVLMTQISTLQLKAKTAAEAMSTKGTVAATVVQRIFNAVAAANPYVLLAVAIISVVGAFALFASKANKAAEEQKKLNEQQKIYNDLLSRDINDIETASGQRIKTIQNEKRVLEARNASAAEILEIDDQLIEERKKTVQESNNAARSEISNLENNRKKLEEVKEEYERVQKAIANGAKQGDKMEIEVDGEKSWYKIKDAVEMLQGRMETIKFKVDIGISETQKAEDLNADIKIQEEKRKKAAVDAQKQLTDRQATERGLIRAAEDAALALVKEGIEKQRRAINQSYDRQIEDLKRKLTEEKNLTAAAKQAINDTIASLEKQQTADLDKLTDEATANRIAKETQRITLMLEATKAGTQQEFDLRKQLLEQNRQAEIAANNALTEEMRQSEADINAKYDQQAADLKEQQIVTTTQKQSEAIQLEWQNRLLAVQQGSMEEYTLKVQAAQAEYDFLLNLDATQKAVMFESDTAYTNAVLANKKKIEDATNAQTAAQQNAVQVQLQAAQAIGKGFEDVLNSFAEDNEAMAAFAKTVALFNIGINTAEAISKATASAKGVTAFDYAIQVATGIATVMANIAKAKQLLSKEKTPKAPKFATGGVVRGSGSGTSDSIQAFLSNGESVNTALATSLFSPLYSALNQMGGGVPIGATQAANQVMGEDMLARAFAKAVATLPNPVVSVEEIDSVKTTVTAYEILRLQ